jgi:hypothetical protein
MGKPTFDLLLSEVMASFRDGVGLDDGGFVKVLSPEHIGV